MRWKIGKKPHERGQYSRQFVIQACIQCYFFEHNWYTKLVHFWFTAEFSINFSDYESDRDCDRAHDDDHDPVSLHVSDQST